MMFYAALQQTPVTKTDHHLAPVIDLLARSLPPKYPQGRFIKMNATSRTLRSPLLNAATRAYSVLKTALAMLGMAALAGVLLLPVPRDPVGKPFSLGDAFTAPMAAAAGPIQARAETPLEREQRVVTEFIAKRYRVADTAIASFVATAYRAGAQHSVDPLLILAVMAVESRYNPVAESTMGAKGLMQVIPKFHLEKLLDHGGEHALLEPDVNIVVGTQILREYTRRLGDLEAALQMYAGALDEPTAQYAGKVFAERARLQALRLKARKQTSQSA